MKKILVILLTLSLAMGAFAGLTLFTVSAEGTNPTSTTTVAGDYSYVDFENESDLDLMGKEGGAISYAPESQLISSGIPTVTPTGKKVGNVLKFSDGTAGHCGVYLVTKDRMQQVVDSAGWYTVSFWMYVEKAPTANAFVQPVFRAFASNSSLSYTGIDYYNNGSLTKTIMFGDTRSLPQATGEWIFYEANLYIYDLAADGVTDINELNKSPLYAVDNNDVNTQIAIGTYGLGSVYYLDSVRFTKVDGTDYDLMQIYKVETSTALQGPNAVKSGLGLYHNGTKATILDYNFNSASLHVTTSWGLRYSDRYSSAGWVNRYIAPHSAGSLDGNYALSSDYQIWCKYGTDICGTRAGAADNALTNPTAEYLAGFEFTHTDLAEFNACQETEEQYYWGGSTSVHKHQNVINYGKVVKNAAPTQPIYSETVIGGNVWYYGDVDGCYTAKATANTGYTFKGWYTGDSVHNANTLVSTDATAYTYGDKLLVAKFDGYTVADVEINDYSGTDTTKIVLNNASNSAITSIDDEGGNGKPASTVYKYNHNVAHYNGGMTFDVAPSVWVDKDKGYNGGGIGTYKLGYWARLDPNDADITSETTGRVSFAFAHYSANSVKWQWVVGPTLTTEWQYFTFNITVTDAALINATTSNANIVANIRFTGETINGSYPGVYGTSAAPTGNMYDWLIDDLTFERVGYVEEEQMFDITVNGSETDVVYINGLPKSTATVTQGSTVEILAQEVIGKTLVGVKYADSNSQIYPAVDGVVNFVMPASDVELELVWRDTDYSGTRITVIGFDNVIFDIVDDTSKLMSATVRVGYTATYNVNGTAYSTFAEAKAAADALITAGTAQFDFTYVYTKKSNDKVNVYVNNTVETVDRLSFYYKTAAATDGSGTAFSYWIDANGNIVSYNRTIAFYPANNIYLTAVYEGAAEKQDVINTTFIKNRDSSITVVSERELTTDFDRHGIKLIEALVQLDTQDVKNILEFKTATASVANAGVSYTLYAKKNSLQGTFVGTKRAADPLKYYYVASFYERGNEIYISDIEEFAPNILDTSISTFENVDTIDQFAAMETGAASHSYQYNNGTNGITRTDLIAKEANGNTYFRTEYGSGGYAAWLSDVSTAANEIDLTDIFKNITEAGRYYLTFDLKLEYSGTNTSATLRPLIRTNTKVDDFNHNANTNQTFGYYMFSHNSVFQPILNSNYADPSGNYFASWQNVQFEFSVTDATIAYIKNNPSTTFVLNFDSVQTTKLAAICLDNLKIVSNNVKLENDAPAAVVDGVEWNVTELTFRTAKSYSASNNEQLKVEFFGEFTNEDGTKTLRIPGYWDGGNSFKLRFTPTEPGKWTYRTVCATDNSLNGKTGTVNVSEYTGDLALYQNGFVKVDSTKKYFVYDNGTPFFYLGDTHWGMISEEFDSAGDSAGSINTSSHFKYIVDKRVNQGYTVYQSQVETANQVNKFYLYDGAVNSFDIDGFKNVDRYFNYIASKGLMHAHTQFGFFPMENTGVMAAFIAMVEAEEAAGETTTVEHLSRYWVARYGAYPVMWTLGQECDNDAYYGDRQTHTTLANNIWVKVAEAINKYDAYNHPTSGHQETYPKVSVTGSGTEAGICAEGASVFYSDAVTQRTGHDWWAAQWGFEYNSPTDAFTVGKDYWNNSTKVAIMYEGKYEFHQTEEFGNRAQGWLAFLNGFYGYGYGIQDIWMYKWATYEEVSADGYSTVTVEEQAQIWGDTVEAASGYQVTYMKQFFENEIGDWYNLVPNFNNGNYFASGESTTLAKNRYSIATNGNNKYVLYLYNDGSTVSGTLKGMDATATYTVKWFNPQTNEYTTVGTAIKSNASGSYSIPAKPSTSDWVLVATKN